MPACRPLSLALIICVLTLAPAAQAAALLPAVGKAAAGRSAAPPVEQQLAEVEAQLAAAEAALAADAAGTEPAPGDSSARQQASTLLNRIVVDLRAQRDILAELQGARQARSAAEQALSAPPPPPPAAPVPLSELDALLDRRDAETRRIASYQSVAGLIQEELRRGEDQLTAQRAAERLAQDRGATGVARELARLQVRAAAEGVRRQALQADLNAELLRAAQARAALRQREIDAIGPNYAFRADDLRKTLDALQSHGATVDRRIDEAAERQRRALARRQALRETAAPADAAAHARALEAADTALDALRIEQSALTTLRAMLPLAASLWQQRFDVMNAADAGQRREAGRAINALRDRVDALSAYATDLGLLADALVQTQQRRIERAGAGADGQAQQDALAAARRAASAAGEVQGAAQRLATAHSRWRQQTEDAAAARSLGQRLADLRAAAAEMFRRVWDFELFAVTDNVVVDGRSTTIERTVTVGKSIGVVALLIGGYWLAGLLMRRVEKIAVARSMLSASQGRMLRRWAMLLVGVLLGLLALNLARIPLTVFAFLGGALAIGVGFGTQTLLKNFISGIIVLFERKVRVGDLVDVDGVQGVVTAVDIRSTTVRQFDGIETLVPNAALLENKVTNWTGETPVMRRVVRIGVAYGSPTRQVADILVAVASEHGQVLDEPAPYVLFEDFGADALVFALYFWVDVMRHSGAQVQSDIRFMLDKRLAEAGISIAFPQRDIHLDSAQPLRIELVRRSSAA
jgi:small-conductance mechanosensitive channel